MVSVSSRPESGSRIRLEIEVPAADVQRHFATAYRHLADRTRVPGFRPGKAPRHVLERYVSQASIRAEAIDHLVGDSYDAALDQVDIIPIDQPEVELDAETVQEGGAVRFSATVAVRPQVTLGAYQDYPFALEAATVAEDEVDAVVAELRDQQATLHPIEDRAAAGGDVAFVSFQGTVDGAPFEGGSAERLPLVIGDNRMVAGWENNLVGMHPGEQREFDIGFPDGYRVAALAGRTAHFAVTLVELRERVLPALDDAFAASVSDSTSVDGLREEIRDALLRRARAESRHTFADRVIEFATANASVDLPEVMISNEVEIMRDELRTRLATQELQMDRYLELARQTPEQLATELREPAMRRVKTLLVLSAIAEKEGIDASEAEIEAEIAVQMARYPGETRLAQYLRSRRGRAYLRMTLRNRTLVESLIDRAVAGSTTEPTPE